MKFGIALGRLHPRLHEIRTVFEELARRLPDLRVAPGADAVYGPSTFVHTIESLPVVFTPV